MKTKKLDFARPPLAFSAQGNVPVMGEFSKNFPISVKDNGGYKNSSTEDIKIIFYLPTYLLHGAESFLRS